MGDLLPKYDFFLAYSKHDEKLADEIYRILSETSSVFYAPRSIEVGKSWPEELERGQRSAGTTIVLVPAAPKDSPYVRSEISRAIELNRENPDRRVVPVFLGKPRYVPGLDAYQGISVPEDGSVQAVVDKLRGIPSTARAHPPAHPLDRYPIGPIVPGHYLSRQVIKAYAQLFDSTRSPRVIDEANALRAEANEGSAAPSLLRPEDLPSAEHIGTTTYWIRAFDEARRHGPRMVAALLLAVDPKEYPGMPKKAVEERAAMLETAWIRDE
jgi:hypothetical protein